MKYLSVCSGIEAATVAWHGLGWTPVAFSEIEPFPAAVLKHHYPEVPNLGDLTKYREWPDELLAEVDLLVGGTPCQAFSVAGQRRSLEDERGNLSLTYVNLFHHINEVRKRHGRSPAIALWENVPGVLSTKDNAFGCFIGGLIGCDEAPQTESGKWDKAGFLSSETVRVGYRVLDAQYFGVAQRRRRVFLVAAPCELVERLGERACPSEILSLRESVLGNPPSRRAAWERVAGTIAGCSNGGGANGPGRTADDADTLVWRGGDQANSEHCYDHTGTLNCDKGQQGGIVAPAYANPLPARMGKGINTTCDEGQTPIVTGIPDPAYAISAGSQGCGGVFGSGRDSQDTFVISGGDVIPINSDADRSNSSAMTPSPDAEGRIRLRDPGIGIGVEGDPMFTLQATKPHAIAFKPGQSEAAGGTFVTDEFAPTMQAQNNGSTAVPAVAFKPSHFTRGKDGAPSEVVAPLSADADKGDQDTVIAAPFTKAKRAQSNHDDESWVHGDVAPTQNQFDVGDTRATTVVAFTQNTRDEVRQINGDGKIVGALSADAGMHQTNYLAFANRTRDGVKVPEVMKDGVVPALTNPGQGGRSDAVNIQQAMQVRRLCPSECEALQGFPVGYTDVPYRNKAAADGPRYRALGNSMAVPCMWWLGMRIAQATSR